MPGTFYERLDKIEALLADNSQLKIEDLGDGLITVNEVLVDTTEQLEMLTPTFFTATAANNPVVGQFKTLFEKAGILPKDAPHIPLIRDIPLRSQTVNDGDGRQQAAFAAFLEEEVLVNQWTHLFPKDFAAFNIGINACFAESRVPLARKTITHDEAGAVLASGGYEVEQHEVNGVNLWLRMPASASEKDVSAAIERTLNDTDNTKAIVEHLKPGLKELTQLAFNVRGVGKNLYSKEDVQNQPLGGGHQYFLMLDREAKTIYGVNNTKGSGEESFPFFKAQIEIFLRSIGDTTQYALQVLDGKSRQPAGEEYLKQVCNVSQFCHYAALLSGVGVGQIRDTVPARVTTLLYVLQNAVINRNQELLDMLGALGGKLEIKEDDTAEPHNKIQYIVIGRDKVNVIIEEILKVATDAAKAAQEKGTYKGSIEQHGDVYAARNLKLAFEHHLDGVERGGETLSDAQKSLSAMIKTARLNLTSHHKVKYLLANLLVGVLSLGIVPIATRVHTGQWAFFRPENAWKLDKLEQETKDLESKENKGSAPEVH
ncbi:MAG: hypothetical protein P1U32_04520 [Legionellaceae bacterium]|nr:hypothetical protein [Legionellaceae bacterium]